jgi:hypothetical protein
VFVLEGKRLEKLSGSRLHWLASLGVTLALLLRLRTDHHTTNPIAPMKKAPAPMPIPSALPGIPIDVAGVAVADAWEDCVIVGVSANVGVALRLVGSEA